MLPTYPKLESWRARLNQDRVRTNVRALVPMMGLVKSHIQFEGRQSAIQRETGELDETPITSASGEISIEFVDLAEFTEELVGKHLDDIAQQLARGMSEHFQQRMHEVTEKVGNVVDGQGKPFSEELFLEVMEKIEHNFGPDGSWQPPTMIVGPGMAEKIAAAGEMSSEGNKRLKAILERKRDDHRRREAARILVG
ncbi:MULTISPECIES: hypothetical protein [unclassified Sphingobium]|uniref:hypothetical protein n=1 Tax=unclassified Sphingobium TaxID=2611147 RepID=UPI0035A6A0A5